MGRFFKKLMLLAAGFILALAVVAALFIYPPYREFKRIADSFDLSEMDKIPAISRITGALACALADLKGKSVTSCRAGADFSNFIKALLARGCAILNIAASIDRESCALRCNSRRWRRQEEEANAITQQLARNTFPLDEPLAQEIHQALLAFASRKTLTKESILEAYCNRIYFGVGLYGVETASRACFGRSANALTLSEAAILAGLIRSPSRLNPLEDTRTALAQRDRDPLRAWKN